MGSGQRRSPAEGKGRGPFLQPLGLHPRHVLALGEGDNGGVLWVSTWLIWWGGQRMETRASGDLAGLETSGRGQEDLRDPGDAPGDSWLGLG